MNFGTNTKTEKYNSDRIQLIKLNLQQHLEQNNPKYYEIQVDGLKVVSKTTDISMFDNYELFLGEDTDKLKIMLFQGNSQKYDSFIFLINDNRVLQGIPQDEDKVKTALRERDLNDAQSKIIELSEALAEAEEYHDALQKRIDELENKQEPSKADKFMELLMLTFQNTMQKNPTALKSIPLVGNALAGFGENEQAERLKNLENENMTMKNALQQMGMMATQPETQFEEKE
jgi:hypothetical protein